MNHFEALKKYLSSFVSIPSEEWQHLVTLMKLQKLEKGELFFKQTQEAPSLGFVVQGLLYNYYEEEDRDNVVKYFIPEGSVVGCYSSMLRQVPAIFSSQALEPTTMLTIKYTDYKSLYDRHGCWDRLGRLTIEKLYIEKEYREQQLMMSDAKKRYELFLKDFEKILNRIPQYLIASYIGITPVALSRVRSANVKKPKSKS